MRLVSYLSGSIQRRVQMEEIAPSQGVPWRGITQKLHEKFKFQAIAHSEKGNQLGAVSPAFRSGEWAHKGQVIPVIGLEFTPIDLEVTCNKTDNAQLIIDEVFNIIEKEYSFSKSDTFYDRFNSQIVVEPNFQFLETLGKWPMCYEMLINIASEYDLKNSIVPLGLKFIGNDGTHLVDDIFSTFSFERRITARPQDNFYFSTAPFKSADHFALLEKMEAALLS